MAARDLRRGQPDGQHGEHGEREDPPGAPAVESMTVPAS